MSELLCQLIKLKIMTVHICCLMLGAVVWSSNSVADGFPDRYIAKQLAEIDTQHVEINLSNMEAGQLITSEYLNNLVLIYRRTAKDIEHLSKNDKSHLADPNGENLTASITTAAYGSSISYVRSRTLLVDQPILEQTPLRSKNDQFFVFYGWSPHTGCAIRLMPPEIQNTEGVVFQDPCVEAFFDGAGRILKGELTGTRAGVSAAFNLFIPPHSFKDNKTLVIGLRDQEVLPELKINQENRYLGKNPTEKLITAAGFNDLDTVQEALNEGAIVKFYRLDKGNPLDAAIYGGSLEIVRLLISHGARPSPFSLDNAKFLGRTEVIKLIKELE